MNRALVIDAETSVRELLAMYLESAGFDVETSTDVADALERPDVDVLLLDLTLVSPDVTRSGEWPLLVALSDRDSAVDHRLVYTLQAAEYVRKPLSPAGLVRRLRVLLSWRAPA